MRAYMDGARTVEEMKAWCKKHEIYLKSEIH
jgi:hypothetical protein